MLYWYNIAIYLLWCNYIHIINSLCWHCYMMMTAKHTERMDGPRTKPKTLEVGPQAASIEQKKHEWPSSSVLKDLPRCTTCFLIRWYIMNGIELLIRSIIYYLCLYDSDVLQIHQKLLKIGQQILLDVKKTECFAMSSPVTVRKAEISVPTCIQNRFYGSTIPQSNLHVPRPLRVYNFLQGQIEPIGQQWFKVSTPHSVNAKPDTASRMIWKHPKSFKHATLISKVATDAILCLMRFIQIHPSEQLQRNMVWDSPTNPSCSWPNTSRHCES